MFFKVMGSRGNPDQYTPVLGVLTLNCTSVDFARTMIVAKGIKCRFPVTVISPQNICLGRSSPWQVYIDFSKLY